eukprot:TRINITY_DN52614_c0_g1_i1.p1 TRINITY_DN52614_c0_g1~~TRINITY_DN52614_c0_g1_i1.p1  ORF type:complete len:115 (-),score=43.70 TRINITY_DN52614_c0_g1_i1:3-347(-)
MCISIIFFFFQAEDGIRDAQESRGLGDVYKRQHKSCRQREGEHLDRITEVEASLLEMLDGTEANTLPSSTCHLLRYLDSTRCLLYTSDAADEEDSVDLGGRRIIKKKNKETRRV